MCRGLGRVEQWIACPYIFDVRDPEMRMLEKVHRLRVDLERVLLIQQARVESVVGHHPSVLQPNTRHVRGPSDVSELVIASMRSGQGPPADEH
jgi:hypothetical protein